MKLSYSFISLLLVIFVFSRDVHGEYDQVVLVADPWCPYNCDTINAEFQGIIIDIANEILTKQGFEVKYQNVPWTRAIAMVLNGKAEGLVGVGKGEVPSLIFPEKPVLTVKHALFTSVDDDWVFDNYSSLRGRAIGAVKSYSYGDFAEKYLENRGFNKKSVFFVHGSNPLDLLIPMLASGRIDTFVAEENVLRYYLKENQLPLKLRNAGRVSQEEIFIGFSPKFSESHRLVSYLDTGVSDEKLLKLMRKYLGDFSLP